MTPNFFAQTQYFSSLYINITILAINLHSMFVITLFTMGTGKYQSYILFDIRGKMAFGHEAQDKFTILNHKQIPKYYYFEHVNECLQHYMVLLFLTPLVFKLLIHTKLC